MKYFSHTVKDKGIIFFICMTISLIFVTMFSLSTSPLYVNRWIGSDSAIFQVIGCNWNKGNLPYVYTWDSKGPFIFLIDAIGYWLTDSRLGIYFIQILSFSFALLVSFNWFHTIFSVGKSYLFCIFFALCALLNYDFGNLTEEYVLPLLMISFYFIYKWMNGIVENKYYFHPYKYSLIYGLTTGFCMMTRFTNCVGLLVGMIFILICLVKKRMWMNILENIMIFLIGFLLIVLPFVIYFHLHGALDEMWFGTLFYNISYAHNSSFDFSLFGILLLCKRYIVVLFLILASCLFILLNRHRRLEGYLWLSVSLFTMIYLSQTNGYIHYGLIGLPYICISVIKLYQIEKFKIAVKVVYSILSLLLLVLIFRVVLFTLNYKSDNSKYEDILELVPINERNLFIAYNTDAIIYANNDIMPIYRFFSCQDWAIKNCVELQHYLLTDFSTCKAKWILIEGQPEHTKIYPIVLRKYQMIHHQSDLWLYRLIQ